MTGIVITMFMAALDATIVGTAMPRLVADLNGFELYAAVTTVYLLATTVVVPIVGKLSDLYGRKPFLLAGVDHLHRWQRAVWRRADDDAARAVPGAAGYRRRVFAGDGVHDHCRPLSAVTSGPRQRDARRRVRAGERDRPGGRRLPD